MDRATSILVVDDYGRMLRIVRNLLHQLGFDHVDAASDGASALAKLHAERYGLVIAAGLMAPMTGFELLAQVRADPRLRALPFIMIAADQRGRELARSQPADGWLVKPVDAAGLGAKIKAVMAG